MTGLPFEVPMKQLSGLLLGACLFLFVEGARAGLWLIALRETRLAARITARLNRRTTTS